MEDTIITPHASLISYHSRCQYYQQQGEIIWFTGLSGSGKSTLATELELHLVASGKIVCLLDGDNIRQYLNSDLGFDEASRKENVRRISELAVYLAKQSLIVLVSVISPQRNMRSFAKERAKLNQIKFTEVFVDASIQTCQQRDPKGLYQKTAMGNVQNFTGLSMLYEAPLSPDIHIQTEKTSIEESLQILLMHLSAQKTQEQSNSSDACHS